MPPTYKLLALDLDGTLLRRDQTVDPRDIAAIAELQRAGVTVTIATGRLQSGAVGAARACAIEGLIACVEGSHVVELATNTTHAHHAMPPALRAVLRATKRSHGLATFVFDAGGIHHDHEGAEFAGYVSTWSPNLRVVEDDIVWEAEPLMTVAIGEPAAIAAAHAALQDQPGLFSVSFPVSQHPGKHAILARAAGRSKGIALAELCAAAGCTLDEAVAVGDWVNDIPMFEAAGRSFAMGGAPVAVQAAASETLPQPAGEGGGIAEAIRRAWG